MRAEIIAIINLVLGSYLRGAMAESKEDFLAYFGCKCRGVKFYDLKSVGATWWTNVALEKEPTNTHDKFCVAVWIDDGRSSRRLQLGHVAKEAARWIHPLLQPQYQVKRFVI